MKILLIVFAVSCVVTGGCSVRNVGGRPSIEFTQVPQADPGGPDKLGTIAGRVTGARSGQKIVLYSKSDKWWVQPLANQPFTNIQADSQWTSSIHLGTEYAALLVEPGYQPPPTVDSLPKEGGLVVSVKTIEGEKLSPSSPVTLRFSGYEWEVRSLDSDRGGTRHGYDPSNAWTDEKGFLHLRIAQKAGQWTCAEVKLTRSLGYGSYFVVVRDASQLDPAVVASMFTWDEQGDDTSHREMSIELTRWGDTANKNAQYVVQPFYVPANVARFMAPAGILTHSFRWEPGKVTFRSVSGDGTVNGTPAVAEHVFNSGVPSPGGEVVHINLYVFGNNTLQSEAEVVIEKFEYLP